MDGVETVHLETSLVRTFQDCVASDRSVRPSLSTHTIVRDPSYGLARLGQRAVQGAATRQRLERDSSRARTMFYDCSCHARVRYARFDNTNTTATPAIRIGPSSSSESIHHALA